MTTTTLSQRPKRLMALDVLRGITIAGMILVNNPGGWDEIYSPLRHASWNGLTPTDLVFPFFMFIMGVSSYLSLRKYNFEFSMPVVWKIVKRTVLIFFVGLFLTWFSMFVRGVYSGAEFWESVLTFDHIRILGVLPRLALCYGVGSLLGIIFSRKALKWLVAAMLVVYAVILVFGHGFEFAEHNVIAIVDRAVLGEAHMYTDYVDGVQLKFDPEGFLSTLPSIAHMLIGFLCGGLIVAYKDNQTRINKLFIVGTVLTFAGFLLSYGLPINKKVWSPTFVLTTCGLASSFLALLIWIIDVKGYRRWGHFFEVFGVNPLFLYCLSWVLALAVGLTRIPWSAAEGGMISIRAFVYQICLLPVCCGNQALASASFAVLFVLLSWGVGYYLYKNKIYIKL